MNLDDQLRAVLDEEARMRTATPPDVPGLISGGRTRRRRRHAVLAGGSVLAAVFAFGGAYGAAHLGGDEDSVGPITHQPTTQPLPDTPEGVVIGPGTYVVPARSGVVVAPYVVTVPAGWTAQHGILLGKHSDEPGAIGIDALALDSVRLAADACTGPETFGATQTSTAGLVAGLRAQGSGPRVSDPVAATVGGLPATRIDLAYPDDKPLSHCRLSATDTSLGQGWLQISTGYFVMGPAETASVYVVDVGGRAQVFVTRAAADASAADRAELESILDSIRFER